uniref:Mannosyltransferase n=1 Tax=Acrobeloides nanus TaxID=290746 RepID=A0A914BUG0_9BILA
MISDTKVFIVAIAFRTLTAFLIQTWFVPDEIFQSIEVAYKIVYHQGHLSWEWHEENSLRSAIHPSCLALIYWVFKWLGLDSNWIIAYAPRIVHTIIFAIGDVFLLKLARRVLNSHEKSIYMTMFIHFTNWFTLYCAPRTLSNSLETALTLIGLNWYPLEGVHPQGRPVWPYLLIASVTVLIRPTAVLIWAPLVLLHLWKLLERWKEFRFEWFLKNMVFPCLISLFIGIIIDSKFYGKFTITIWNFALFNVFKGGSAHFGTHPWHWYFTQGWLPLLTMSSFPTIMGLYKTFPGVKKPTKLFFYLSAFYIGFHSLLAHKEHRFLLPLLPLLSIYTGHYLGRSHSYEKFWKYSILLVNFALAIYFCLVHQKGPYSAHSAIFEDLEMEFVKNKSFGHKVEIFQLMPCYSMPLYAHFYPHKVTIQMLDCSPNLSGIPNYIDESNIFHENPFLWTETNFNLTWFDSEGEALGVRKLTEEEALGSLHTHLFFPPSATAFGSLLYKK